MIIILIAVTIKIILLIIVSLNKFTCFFFACVVLVVV